MVKRVTRRRTKETGQATALVVLGLAFFVLGSLGLAVDGSHLYAQRQMAQAAADAAATAGITSIFNGTSTGNLAANSAYYCIASDTSSPCSYLHSNGFGLSSTAASNANCTATNVPSDCAYVNPAPSTPSGFTGTLDAGSTPNMLQVTVSRPVSMTLGRFLGLTNLSVTAVATAAIVDVLSPVPIIVTHPTNTGTFAMNGGVTIQICGGPSRSIQVNSRNANTQNISGNSNIVDLTKAGPNDPGNCTTGTGADFGDSGGPRTPSFNLSSGVGKYWAPIDPVTDPLATVNPPSKPGTAGVKTTVGWGSTGTVPTTFVSSGTVTCPASTKPGGCDFFLPGDYPSGISASGSNNYVAYFFPGVYYLDSNGFVGGSNGNMQMYPGANSDTSANGTGAGMLVYNTGNGLFIVGKNAGASLVGSDTTSVYKGILFFQDRNSVANSTKNTQDHIIGGGGALSLSGTIYITNSLSVMTNTPAQYQLLQLQGGGGNNTLIQGEIIASQLLLGGSGTIRMNLNPAATTPVRQIALIQ